MRKLEGVIDQIIAIVPADECSLLEDLARFRVTVLYTAPELMPLRWRELAVVMNAYALNKPWTSEAQRIFSGE